MLEPVRNYMRLKNEMKGYYTPGSDAAPSGYVFASLEDDPSSAEESEIQRETHEKLLGTNRQNCTCCTWHGAESNPITCTCPRICICNSIQSTSRFVLQFSHLVTRNRVHRRTLRLRLAAVSDRVHVSALVSTLLCVPACSSSSYARA